VFKFLGPREVQKIGVAMATLKNVTREQVDERDAPSSFRKLSSTPRCRSIRANTSGQC
jgi:hypothetical protein